MIKFFTQMEIPKATAQQKGVQIVHGRPHFYEKKSITAARDFYAWAFSVHAPDEPMKGAITVRLGFHYPAKRKKDIGQPKITRPDCDNLAKLVIDVMTDLGFWVDDAQITTLMISKDYGDISGIEVCIMEVTHDD